MSRRYLVRHGSTSWTGVRYCGRSDPPLDARGRAQAAALADTLAVVPLRAPQIISSPAARSRETAEAVARRLGTGIMLDERLREADFGAAEGLTFEELGRRFPLIARALLAGGTCLDWPGGERAADLARRARDVWSDLACADGIDLVVVTHGWVSRALVEAALGARVLDAAAALECGTAVLLERHVPAGAWRMAGIVGTGERQRAIRRRGREEEGVRR